MEISLDPSVDIEAVADERQRASNIAPLINRSAREIQREADRCRKQVLRAGAWPGFAASVQDLTRPGQWIAVILLNRGPHRYVRKESYARFTTSEEAYSAAESWLRREIEKSR